MSHNYEQHKYLTAKQAAKHYGKEVVFILKTSDGNERRRGKINGSIITGIEDNRVMNARLLRKSDINEE